MLKPNRFFNPADSEVSYFMNETGEAGSPVAYPTGDVMPPGLDDAEGIAVIPTATNQHLIGILCTNVVESNDPLSGRRQHLNEVWVGDKVEIVRAGWFVTNRLEDGITPSPGDNLYFNADGLFTDQSGSAKVGKFESAVDEDGYARILLRISN